MTTTSKTRRSQAKAATPSNAVTCASITGNFNWRLNEADESVREAAGGPAEGAKRLIKQSHRFHWQQPQTRSERMRLALHAAARYQSAAVILILTLSSSLGVHSAPTRAANTDHQQEQQSPLELLLLQPSAIQAAYLTNQQATIPRIELANRPSHQDNVLSDAAGQQQQEDSVVLLLIDQQQPQSLVHSTSSSPSSRATSIRRLIKRSGISDQRLAEIQMIRALKKQLERASKLAASNLNSASQESGSS